MKVALRFRAMVWPCVLLVALSTGAAPSVLSGGPQKSQEPTPSFARIPFDRWAQEGPRKDIRWKTKVHAAELSIHQRLLVQLDIYVPMEEAYNRRNHGKLVALLDLKDRTGNVFRSDQTLELDPNQQRTRGQEVRFAWAAHVIPGDYDVSFAVYDSQTLERSFTATKMHIGELKKDPLPNAWADLPHVEFLEAKDPPDAYFRPEARGRLRLPIINQRDVRLHLIVNLSPTEDPAWNALTFDRNLSRLLPIVKLFAAVDRGKDLLDVEMLDLTRHSLVFIKKPGEALEWEKLRAALTAETPASVDVHALLERKQNAAYLRNELTRRIEEQFALGDDPRRVLHVFVLLSSPVAFEPGANLARITPHDDCHCLFFYLRPEGSLHVRNGRRIYLNSGLSDEIEGLIKPLKPRVLSPHSPLEMRRALARILSEISAN